MLISRTKATAHCSSTGLQVNPGPFLLTVIRPASTQGRYDIMAARPDVCITTQDYKTKIQTCSQSYTVLDGPFAVLGEQLSETRKTIHNLPFTGGAIGFFSYDLCRYMEKIPSVAADDIAIPDMAIGIYPWAVVVDHKRKKAVLIGDHSSTRTKRDWNELIKLFTSQTARKKRPKFRVNTPDQFQHDAGVLQQRIQENQKIYSGR